MKKILALFTCFNRKNKTIKCVESLRSGNLGIIIDFLVCDDNSTDGTKDALRTMENVYILQGTGSLFYTGGMRRVIDEAHSKYTDYDYYLLMNDDVTFEPHAIEKLIAQESMRNEVIVGCTYGLKHELTYGGIIFDNPKKCVRYTKYGPQSDNLEFQTFHANCVLIPANIFFEAGNMDEKYNHSLGDLDYGLKISRLGYKIRVSKEYVGECVIDSSKNTWVDKSLPRIQRIKKKESLKGVPTKEWFHFVYKNFGFRMAVFYSITPYIKIILKR